MNCSKIQQELSAYLDDALTPARRTELDAHLVGCPDCRKRLKELGKVATGIAALPKVPVPTRFEAAVRLKIREELRQSARPTWFDVLFRPLWLKLPVEALAVVAAVVALMVLQRPHVGPQQAESDSVAVAPTPPAASAPKSFYARIEEPATAEARAAAAPAQPAPVLADGVGGAMVADRAIETPRFTDASGSVRELLTVRSSDIAKAKSQVAAAVAGLQGMVISDQQQILTVNLPAQNVERFKTQLASNLKVQTLPGASARSSGRSKDSLAEASGTKVRTTSAVALRKSGEARDDRTNALADAVLEIRILPLEK